MLREDFKTCVEPSFQSCAEQTENNIKYVSGLFAEHVKLEIKIAMFDFSREFNQLETKYMNQFTDACDLRRDTLETVANTTKDQFINLENRSRAYIDSLSKNRY